MFRDGDADQGPEKGRIAEQQRRGKTTFLEQALNSIEIFEDAA
jgi:hypothetical protein